MGRWADVCAQAARWTALCLLPASAAAGAGSADFELVRPRLGPGGIAGLDAPEAGARGTVRGALLLQYERNPLVLWEWGEERGPIVENRVAAWAAFSADVSRSFAVRGSLPVAGSWGSAVPELAAGGVGAGDPWLGVRGLVGPVGLRADLALPFGAQDRWLGERSPRLAVGAFGGARLGRVELLADAGVTLRPPHAGDGFASGPELSVQPGLSVPVGPVRAWVQAVLRADLGARALLVSAEPLAGLRLDLSDTVSLDLGGGRGLTGGYGTTDLRLLAQLQVTRARRPEAVEPPRLPRADVVEDRDLPPPPPPPPPPPGLPGPVRFAQDRADLSPEALTVVDALAAELGADGQLAHVVLVGHASEEAGHGYNYELATRRARAVFEALVARGVHPDRLSFRAMGEVAPTAPEPGVRPEDRRVEALLVHRLAEGDAWPIRAATMPLPWSGEVAPVLTPPRPAAPPTWVAE